MKRKRYMYGLMGLLSLLGFIGVFTNERTFLAFFAFAVDFEYFFIKSDEMLDEYMNKSAARAFYCGMFTVAIVTLVNFFAMGKTGNEALLSGLAIGWVASVIVHAVSTAYYGFRERWRINDD